MDVDEREGVEHETGVDEDHGVDDEHAFGDFFAKLLLDSSLNQRDLSKNRADLAEKLKVSEQAVSSWELGKRLPGSRKAVMNIARALELDDGEKNALRGAWQRSREAKDGRGTKARPAPEAATFTRAERNRRVLALRLPHMRLPHMGRPSTAQFVIAAAVLLTLVVLAGVSAVTHRPPQLGGAVTTGHTTATPVIPKPVSTVPASSSPAGVTRAIASVTKSGPCRWYAYLTVTGLPPRAHVVLFSDYIGHSCNGRTYHGTWRRAAGMVGSSGTWSYALVQNDYGTYRYTAVTAAGTRTPIDFHYGPRARAIG